MSKLNITSDITLHVNCTGDTPSGFADATKHLDNDKMGILAEVALKMAMADILKKVNTPYATIQIENFTVANTKAEVIEEK